MINLEKLTRLLSKELDGNAFTLFSVEKRPDGIYAVVRMKSLDSAYKLYIVRDDIAIYRGQVYYVHDNCLDWTFAGDSYFTKLKNEFRGIRNEMSRATIGSAGYDFVADSDIEIKAGQWTTVFTDVDFSDLTATTFEHWFMMLVPRSGLATKIGLRLRNTVGIVDMDYRQPIRMTITADCDYTIKAGDRYAQGIIVPFGIFTDEKEPIKTRTGGTGSTGA